MQRIVSLCNQFLNLFSIHTKRFRCRLDLASVIFGNSLNRINQSAFLHEHFSLEHDLLAVLHLFSVLFLHLFVEARTSGNRWWGWHGCWQIIAQADCKPSQIVGKGALCFLEEFV